MYFLFCFRSRTLEQNTAWKICEGVGGRWANLRGEKPLRRTPRGFLMQLHRACIHNHMIYSLRSILTFINTNVSRYILVLHTSVFIKGNIGQWHHRSLSPSVLVPLATRHFFQSCPKPAANRCIKWIYECDWTQICSSSNQFSLFVLQSIKFCAD
jgi:hypothetical protein